MDSECEPSDNVKCTKLSLAENLAAYLEKRELERETNMIDCDSGLLEKVANNYVIVRKIISYLPWQDKLLCKSVCSMWNSVVHSLEKEQQSPVDFVIDMQMCATSEGVKFKTSNYFATEPLAVMAFVNTSGLTISSKCEALVPCPCTPPCDKEHCLVDVMNMNICAPKTTMLTVTASYLSYMPLPQSITYEHMITNRTFAGAIPFLCGVYIPVIPGVQYHVINITSVEETEKKFYEIVGKLAKDQYVKGILTYLTDTYILHSSIGSLAFLNYIKEIQPDYPYALGGCIVEDVMLEQRDIEQIVENVNNGTDFISSNVISIGLFSVSKTDANCNFEMYSLVIEPSDWTRSKIQKTINEFSKKVPQFEHSVVLKLSCIGRDKKHEIEQDYFRAAFPRTPLVGCYGNGELGINHPPRTPDVSPTSAKRQRSSPQSDDTTPSYSYSTVFVYIGWGKILNQN